MEWIFLLIIWNFFGFVILAAIKEGGTGGVIEYTKGWGFVNPWCVKKYNNVNWFGAFIVAMIYSTFCPIATIIYWLYMACTAGA